MGQQRWAELGKFVQGELDDEFVAHWMSHCLWVMASQAHPQPEAAGIKSGIYGVPRTTFYV